jgi:hypothetical protein
VVDKVRKRIQRVRAEGQKKPIYNLRHRLHIMVCLASKQRAARNVRSGKGASESGERDPQQSEFSFLFWLGI